MSRVFLWGSPTDGSLFKSAESGGVKEEVSKAVQRMLEDPKLSRSVTHLRPQSGYVWNPDHFVGFSDPRISPEFTSLAMRIVAMMMEPFAALWTSLMENLPVQIYDSSFTYVQVIWKSLMGSWESRLRKTWAGESHSFHRVAVGGSRIGGLYDGRVRPCFWGLSELTITRGAWLAESF